VRIFYIKEGENIPRNTVNWRIYQLLQLGTISRVGRGKYQIGSSFDFKPQLDSSTIFINNQIKKKFPFSDYCIWKTDIIKELALHQSFTNFTIVEIERDSLDATFQFLKEEYKYVYLKPKKDIVENYLLDMPNPIIIQHLISEAPIQIINNIPTISLEKLLVDLVFGKDLFYFYQGYELIHIFQRAFDKYTINENKLLRYASRRGRRKEISKMIKTINRQ